MSKNIENILIVCTGNTARSPAGEYLAKFYSRIYGISLNIESAGQFNAFSYMQPESQEYLNSKGIIHSDFKPQTLNISLLKRQDLIITMEEHHKKHILKGYSDIQDIEKKLFTLKEFNGEEGDIIDPYYTNRTIYMKVMKEIDELIEKMIKKIKELNEENA